MIPKKIFSLGIIEEEQIYCTRDFFHPHFQCAAKSTKNFVKSSDRKLQEVEDRSSVILRKPGWYPVGIAFGTSGGEGGGLEPTFFHIKLVGVHIFVFSHVYSAYLWLLVTERWSFWFWFYSWRQRSSITKVEGIVSSLSRQSHYCRRCRSHPEYKIYEMRKHLNETFFCKKRPASKVWRNMSAYKRQTQTFQRSNIWPILPF